MFKWERKLGEVLPPFYYGLAYENYMIRRSVFYLIPINYFVRWGLAIQHKWDWFRSSPSWVDKQIEAALPNIERDIQERYRNSMLRGISSFVGRLKAELRHDCSVWCFMIDTDLCIRVSIRYRGENLGCEMSFRKREILDAIYEDSMVSHFIGFTIGKMKDLMNEVDKKEMKE